VAGFQTFLSGRISTFGDTVMNQPYKAKQWPELSIEINGSDLTEQQRTIAMDSIRAMAMRSIEIRDRARAKEAELAKVSEVIYRPLRTLFEQDTGAVEELRSLLEQRRLIPDVDLESFVHPDPSAPRIEDAIPSYLDLLTTKSVDNDHAPTAAVRGERVPPFDFDWIWHRQDGSQPEVSLADRTTGRVLLVGSSGPAVPPHGQGKFVEVHAGCGLFLRASGNGLLIGGSSRRFMKFYYLLSASGLGSNATTEGGTECTILENGQFKAGETRRMWRKRISVDEHDEFQSNLFGDGPMRLEQPARAGAEYTFNVGLWLYVDHTSGIGQAGSLARASLDIPVMEIMGP
jgi:hypothetical protein